ncbi:MAG: DUF4476 domain-containing protein [Flavobacteriales bacterium]
MDKLQRFAVLLFLFFGFAGWSVGQTGFTLTAPDTLRYSLYLNGELSNPEAAGSLTVDTLSAGDCLIDLMVQGDPMTHVRARLNLDTTGLADLELIADQQLRYRLVRHDVQTVVDYTRLNGTRQAESLELVVTQVERAGCAPPLAPSLFDRKIAEVEALPFERDKLKHLKPWIGKTCLTTAQIRTVVELIEDEDRRLEVLVAAHAACFDRSKFSTLVDLLYLSRSRDQFMLMVND